MGRVISSPQKELEGEEGNKNLEVGNGISPLSLKPREHLAESTLLSCLLIFCTFVRILFVKNCELLLGESYRMRSEGFVGDAEIEFPEEGLDILRVP